MKKMNIIILTHGNFGEELIKSAEMIIGRIDDIKSLSLTQDLSLDDLLRLTRDEISGIENDVILMTDLFGGTPNNVASYFNGSMNIPVITGINLPMLISIVMERENVLSKGLNQRNLVIESLNKVIIEAKDAIRII